MIGGVGPAHQVLIGPAVQVGVLAADDAVARIADPALALVHGVAEMAEVDALGVFVAAVGVVLTGVFGFTHLSHTGRWS